MLTPQIGPLIVIAAILFAAPANAANIVETAKADGHFIKLLAANDAAGTTALLEGKGPFTVFAPNDTAIEIVPADKLDALMAPDMRTMLKVTLANHVVTGFVDTSAIEDGLTRADAVAVIAANNMPLMFKREVGGITVNDAHIISGAALRPTSCSEPLPRQLERLFVRFSEIPLV